MVTVLVMVLVMVTVMAMVMIMVLVMVTAMVMVMVLVMVTVIVMVMVMVRERERERERERTERERERERELPHEEPEQVERHRVAIRHVSAGDHVAAVRTRNVYGQECSRTLSSILVGGFIGEKTFERSNIQGYSHQ